MKLASFFKRKQVTQGCVGLAIQPAGLAYASANAQGQINLAGFLSTPNPLQEAAQLRNELEAVGLLGKRVNLIPAIDDYQTFLLESPDVPAEELRDALRWRVKDLIDFSIEDAQLDYIELPDDAFRGRRMLYAVITRKTQMEDYRSWVNALGMELAGISVHEVALLQLMQGLIEDETGTGVLWLNQPSSLITMMANNALYFCRHLKIDGPRLVRELDQFDTLVLDLQRSMDYYESQVGKPPCLRLVTFPPLDPDASLLASLREQLPLDIHSLALADLFDLKTELVPEHSDKLVMALAATQLQMPEVSA